MTQKKVLTHEEKEAKLREQAFKKRWGQKCKLAPDMRLVAKNIGKAPACNTNTAKKEVPLKVDTKKKKK